MSKRWTCDYCGTIWSMPNDECCEDADKTPTLRGFRIGFDGESPVQEFMGGSDVRDEEYQAKFVLRIGAGSPIWKCLKAGNYRHRIELMMLGHIITWPYAWVERHPESSDSDLDVVVSGSAYRRRV